jgi:hypothetical protein
MAEVGIGQPEERKHNVNILETILSAGGGGIVNQLANQFGITADQATAATTAILPALAGGLKEKLDSGEGSSILKLINSGSLTQFADNPAGLATPAALDQGKSLLSGIFGSGDTSHLISMVAEKVGLSSGLIRTMLPIGATLLGSILSKKAAAGGNVADTLGQLASVGHSGLLDAVKNLASRVLG